MQARHVLDAAPALTHGSMVERVLFRRRGSPDADGLAVLAHVERFAAAVLAPGTASVAARHDAAEEVFFVTAGVGVVASDGREQPVRDGDGVLVPAGVDHAFRNTGDAPLELLRIETAVARATSDGGPPLVRNYRDVAVGCAHWHYFSRRIFGPDDGLVGLSKLLVVRVEPLTAGEPHGHPATIDEVWHMWRGTGIHLVGRELYVQRPGTAVQVAPSEPSHVLLNHGDTPLDAVYFSCLR